MFFAHSAAGYLLSKPLSAYLAKNNREVKQLLLIGMTGSIFPDLDLLYFYLIDAQQHPHHSYWTHIPYFWALVSSFFMAVASILNSRMLAHVIAVFTLNILLHLFLDTFFGGIYWLLPFERTCTVLFEIPARYAWWPLNYLLHWSIILELVIVSLAATVYLKSISPQSIFEMVKFKFLSANSKP
jgi:inner membrane protein